MAFGSSGTTLLEGFSKAGVKVMPSGTTLLAAEVNVTVRRKPAELHRNLCIKVSKCATKIYIIFNVMLSGSTKEKDEGPLGQLVPREFDPKRQQWVQKGKGSSSAGWENYQGIGKGKGKHQSSTAPTKRDPGQRGIGDQDAHIGRIQINGIQPHNQYQRLAFEEPVEWNGIMYTKFTFRDGRVEYQAW